MHLLCTMVQEKVRWWIMILHPDRLPVRRETDRGCCRAESVMSVSFIPLDEEKEVTVFEYLSEEFVRLQNEINTNLRGDGNYRCSWTN